jgi:hypothetical protein
MVMDLAENEHVFGRMRATFAPRLHVMKVHPAFGAADGPVRTRKLTPPLIAGLNLVSIGGRNSA